MSLLDKLVAQSSRQTEAEQEVTASGTHHTLDTDEKCPNCGRPMQDTFATNLPAKICFPCRIALPGDV
jgi:hypothetical protein